MDINNDGRSTVPPGTVTFRKGSLWVNIRPNENGVYSKENILYTGSPPIGAQDSPQTGKTAKQTLQVVGRETVTSDIDIVLGSGWATTHISSINGLPVISFGGGSQAATTRWTKEHNPNFIRKPKRKRVAYVSVSSTPSPYRTNRKAQTIDIAKWELLRSEVYIRDKGICWVCNDFVLLRDYQLGHLIDRSNGGSDTLGNCAVMHKSCNNSKPRHLTLEEAMTWKLTIPA